jgi:hypothetical protein
MGGLGNQLFQYAAGRALSCKYNTTLLIDISNYFFDFRSYELNKFYITGQIARTSDLIHYSKYNAFINFLFLHSNFHKNVLAKTLLKKGSEFRDNLSSHQNKCKYETRDVNLINGKYVAERFLHYDPEFINSPDNIYLMGYWHSEKYFKNIIDIVREEFKFREPIKTEIVKKIKNSNSVSIHIRRGDKSNIGSNYYTTEVGYIYRAIDIIKSHIENPVFFIFSDEPEWVNENLEIQEPFNIITSFAPDQDLQLMSLCNHNIIAESSFSWWGGWLNPNKNKIIIAPNPKRWNKLFSDTQDIYPEKWIIIEKW